MKSTISIIFCSLLIFVGPVRADSCDVALGLYLHCEKTQGSAGYCFHIMIQEELKKLKPKPTIEIQKKTAHSWENPGKEVIPYTGGRVTLYRGDIARARSFDYACYKDNDEVPCREVIQVGKSCW